MTSCSGIAGHLRLHELPYFPSEFHPLSASPVLIAGDIGKIGMDPTWQPSIYRTNGLQTAVTGASPPLHKALSESTVRLQEQPYDPALWNKRASIYLSLGYPELAVGDAYRAGLLLDGAPSNQTEPLNTSTRTSQESKEKERLATYQVLGQALYDCHCHWEAAEVWKDAAKKFPDSVARSKAAELQELLQRKQVAAAPLGGTAQEQLDRLRDGGVLTVQYPWMEERHRTRNKETIDLINTELGKNLRPQSCKLRQSTLSDGDDMLGVFAVRDIRMGECILLSRTATGTCSTPKSGCCDNCYGNITGSPHQASCCSTIYCSSECLELAITTYHPVLCGQDFTWLFEPAKGLKENGSPLRPLLMLRLLAACIQDAVHPLDHPLIARLQPLANRDHLDVFTLTESIIVPMTILKQLGIDVFANPNFDTWILHTIWTRLANNKAGSTDTERGFVDLITPFQSLFNHSCGPNLEFRREEGSTTVRLFARRDISVGEELFIGYRNVEGMGLDERVQVMWPWFEGPCLCRKCMEEGGKQ